MTSLLIRNVSLAVIEPGVHLSSVDVYIEDGVIRDVGRATSIDREADEIVDARGLILTPGLASGHTHLSLYPVRAMYKGMRLDEWVYRVLSLWEPRMTSEDSYNASLLATARLILGGVTFAADMHFNMNDVARAVDLVGLRADLSVALMRHGLRKDFERLLNDNIRLHDEWAAHPRITISFSPCSIRLLDPDDIRRIFLEARHRKARIHMHLSEVAEDTEYSLRISSVMPAFYLDRIAGLGEDVVLAHGTWLSRSEISLISRRKASVIHNPWANMLLGSGLAPIREALDLGVNVGLGVDVSPSYSVVDEMRAAYGSSMLRGRPVSLLEIYYAATRGGYKAFGLRGGVIRRGFLADLVLWRPMKPITVTPEEALVYGGMKAEVTVVGGDIVASEGRLLRVEDSILARASRHVESRLGRILG